LGLSELIILSDKSTNFRQIICYLAGKVAENLKELFVQITKSLYE